MTITIGDSIPAVTLKHLTPSGMADISTETLFAGKKTALFAVPGAFTPTCSQKHLPSYVANFDALKAQGFDQIVCLAVNDPFVMAEWLKQSGADGKIIGLPDGNATFTKALGLDFDGSGFGLGLRCQRFSAVVENGKITALNVEKAGGYELSGAECLLSPKAA